MYRRYSPTNQNSPNPHHRQPQSRPTSENHQHTQQQQHTASQKPNTPQQQHTNTKPNTSPQRTVKRQQQPRQQHLHNNIRHIPEKPSVPSQQDNPPVASIKKETAAQNNGISGLLSTLIPKGLYNPETKKIMGILSSEDLLLIALIFIFLENNTEDNPIIALALLYVLLSEYIDLGDFSF